MRVWLPLPPTWPLMTRGDQVIAVVPGHADHPDLSLELSPVHPMPDDDAAWMREVLERDAAGPVTLLESREARTELGWQVQVVHATVGEPGTPALEQRLAGFYQFLDFAGSVLVRATSVGRYEAHRAELLALLARARPDFTTAEPVALADLYR